MGEAAKAESDLVISRLSAPSRSAWRRVAQNKGNGQANYYQHTQDYERQIHGAEIISGSAHVGRGICTTGYTGTHDALQTPDARKSPAQSPIEKLLVTGLLSVINPLHHPHSKDHGI